MSAAAPPAFNTGQWRAVASEGPVGSVASFSRQLTITSLVHVRDVVIGYNPCFLDSGTCAPAELHTEWVSYEESWNYLIFDLKTGQYLVVPSPVVSKPF